MVFPCPANILLWMRRQTGRTTVITQNASPSKMGSRKQATATIHVATVDMAAPAQQWFPTALQQFLALQKKLVRAHSAVWVAKARGYCSATVYTSFVLTSSGNYLLFFPFVVKTDLPRLSHHPKNIPTPLPLVLSCSQFFS